MAKLSFPYIRRATSIRDLLKKHSVLLLGPRRTGKSSLIQHEIQADQVYSLLNSQTFQALAFRPSLIREQLKATDQVIVIDEIQKLPNLMDEVHLMIEENRVRFLLTGSSARKLKRTHTSLMAGRARRKYLFPLTAFELGDQFDLKRALLYGTLPSIFLSEDPWDDLKSYVGDYLKEEILAEALSRNIESFARFLQTAAISHGEILNFEKIGLDAQVPARTIREYYSILEDTLIGSMVQPLALKKGRKSVSKSKFYFFDTGVVNALLGRKSLSEKTPEFGALFETWVFLEIKAYLEYKNVDFPIQFWRTQQGQEVDFVLGDHTAIEVKSSSLVADRHLTGLKELESEMKLKHKVVVSLDAKSRSVSGVDILNYHDFIDQLWSGKLD